MTKKDFDISLCWVDFYDLDFGHRIYVCRNRKYNYILGVVWGTPYWNNTLGGKESHWGFFDVHSSYVLPHLRRKGIRTLINKKISEDFHAIITSGGSQEGKKFMQKSGYKEDFAFGWVKKIKHEEKK